MFLDFPEACGPCRASTALGIFWRLILAMMCITYRLRDNANIAHLGQMFVSDKYKNVSSDPTSNESNLMRILPTYSLRFVMLGLLGLSSKCVDDDIMTTTIHRELRFAMSSYLLSTIFSDFVSCLGDVVEVPCCEVGCRRDCFTKLVSQPIRWTGHISQDRKSTRRSSLVHDTRIHSDTANSIPTERQAYTQTHVS